MKLNPLTTCDFYKTSHRPMYPTGTEMVYSNFTPRSTRLFPTVKSVADNRVVFVGLQGFMKWFLQDVFTEGFFDKPKTQVVRAYKRRMDNALGPDMVTVEHIEDLHDLGYLPLEIMALPEGSKVDPKVPLFTVHNTLPEFFWLVNYLETVFSNSVWKSIVNATTAYRYRQVLEHFADLTGTPKEVVGIQAHDFSCRGMGGPYDSAMAGLAHLVFFEGTDTISAIDYAEDYYGANSDEELVGCSVPSTEHSVMCMGGKETELETFRRLIKLHPEGVLAIVSDTWDFWKVITEFAAELKDEIEARQPNALGLAKIVFRPDSGDPANILCGIEVRTLTSEYNSPCNFDEWKEMVAEEMDNQFRENLEPEKPHQSEKEFWHYEGQVFEVTYEPELNRHDKRYYYVDNCGDDVRFCDFKLVVLTPEQKGAVQCLYESFGGTRTDTGHLMLNERIGLIYGDSITLQRCEDICQRLADKGFASGNVVFGIGSYTYQYNTRDTIGAAMKATYGVINGEGVEIFKDPKTDSGEKKSAKGLLHVESQYPSGRLVLKDQSNWSVIRSGANVMRTVFHDGRLTDEEDLATIRNRARG